MRSTTKDIRIGKSNKSSFGPKELWLYRELFVFFAWRDIKVRYKQTFLGASWAIIQPVLTAAIFTLFFNRVAKIPSGAANIPYPVFAYFGLLYWNSFSAALNTVSNSILSAQGVITKIYFPRLIPPLAATALSIVDFIFALIIFFIMLPVFNVTPTILGVALIIPSLVLVMVAAFGAGLFFAALNVKYRDVKSALPFIIQIGMFVTPVIYPITLIPQRFQLIAYANPATGAISSVKNAMFGQPVNWLGLGISWASTIIILLIGLLYFRKMEKGFVDII